MTADADRGWRRLLCAVLIQAIADGQAGCPAAAHWLDECGVDLAEHLFNMPYAVFVRWRTTQPVKYYRTVIDYYRPRSRRPAMPEPPPVNRMLRPSRQTLFELVTRIKWAGPISRTRRHLSDVRERLERLLDPESHGDPPLDVDYLCQCMLRGRVAELAWMLGWDSDRADELADEAIAALLADAKARKDPPA